MINLTNTHDYKGVITILLLFLSSLVFAQLNVTPDRADAYYEMGETVNFNITSNNSGIVNYTLKYDNISTPISTGSLNINAGQTLTVPYQSSESGVVLCAVEQLGNSASAGAAFSPYEIEAFVDEPADFDAFWNNQKNILGTIPIDPQITFHSNTTYSTTYRVNLASIDNRRVYGYLTVPNGTGPFPAFIKFPPYGDIANTALPDIEMAERGNALSFSVSIHNAEPDVVDPNAYEPDDISDKNGLYYRTAIMAGIRVVDYIFSRSDFDGNNLGVTGVSQGAGLSVLIGGLDNRVKYMIMSNPILGQASGLQLNRAGGFPNFISQSRLEVGTAAHEALTAEAIKYYDAVFFARRFQGTSWNFISYEDVVTPAATSFAVFNALGGKKFLTHSLNLGHTQPFEFWNNRYDFMRRFIPGTLNPPFPFSSSNQGYFIDAGQDINVAANTSTNLAATVEYNTSVNPNYELEWKKIDGPGNVSFGNPTSYNTTATFDTEGVYTLQLTAIDYSNDLYGEQKYYALFDEITVTVGSGGSNTGCTNPTNIAIGKISNQSSTQAGGVSGRANDGDTNGNFWNGSVAQTNWSNQPWWEVDLGAVTSIENINIWNRTDCCGSFFKDFYVLLSDVPFTSYDLNTTLNQAAVQSFHFAEVVGAPTNINIGQSGRYVRIQMAGTGFMTLAEAEIFGCEGQSSLQTQNIIFDPIPNKLNTDSPFSVNALSTSGLPVTLEVIDGPATINGDVVTLDGTTGTVFIKATQLGDNQYSPAPEVVQSFDVEEEIVTGDCNNPQNVSLGKPTNQSSTLQNGSSDKAVDGNTEGNFWSGSVAQTNWSNQPWWQIDLEKVIEIDNINIWNRTDCCSSFFKDFYVFVSDEPFTSFDLNTTLNQPDVQSFFIENVVGSPSNITIEQSGRYVRIHMTGSGFMTLAEVEIFGCDGGGGTTTLPQDIFFDAIPDKLTTDGPFSLNANSSSGLPVSFEIVSGPATINGNQIELTGQPGTVTVVASQGGDSQYDPAMDVTRDFKVSEPNTTDCTTPENLSMNKPSGQSGTQVGATSYRAVDGNTDGNFWVSNSVTNTNWQANAWWQVDLLGVADIQTINVWNRTDCCQNALSNFYILVSDEPFLSTDLDATLDQNGVSSYFIGNQAGSPSVVDIERTGRYVRVQLQGSGVLTMAELEVMGCPPANSEFLPPSTNVTGKIELPSSIIYPNPAENVVSVNTNIFIGRKLEIQVFDLLGVLVLQDKIEEVAGGTYEISLARLESGTYFVNLLSEGFDKKPIPLVIFK